VYQVGHTLSLTLQGYKYKHIYSAYQEVIPIRHSSDVEVNSQSIAPSSSTAAASAKLIDGALAAIRAT